MNLEAEATARASVVAIAEDIIQGRVGIVEGCRAIAALRHETGDSKNVPFGPIVGFESETDHYPIGEVRKRYNSEYVQSLDRELDEHINQDGELIKDACRTLIRAFRR